MKRWVGVIPLDSDRAPRVTEVELKNLPGGQYEVVVVLHDGRGGHTVARAPVTVLSRFGE